MQTQPTFEAGRGERDTHRAAALVLGSVKASKVSNVAADNIV